MLFRSRGFDRDIRTHLSAEMTKRGVRILPDVHITAIEKTKGGFIATSDSGEKIETDLVMCATGRTPNSQRIGLQSLGAHFDKSGAITVDEWQQTTVPGVYAVGDCTNKVNLTPVAIAESRALAETLFNRNPIKMDHHNVPSAVFSQPPVGTVGLSEIGRAHV